MLAAPHLLRTLPSHCSKSRKRHPLQITVVDLTKSFDVVSREELYIVLQKKAVRLDFPVESCFSYKGALSDPFKNKNGAKHDSMHSCPNSFSILLRYSPPCNPWRWWNWHDWWSYFEHLERWQIIIRPCTIRCRNKNLAHPGAGATACRWYCFRFTEWNGSSSLIERCFAACEAFPLAISNKVRCNAPVDVLGHVTGRYQSGRVDSVLKHGTIHALHYAQKATSTRLAFWVLFSVALKCVRWHTRSRNGIERLITSDDHAVFAASHQGTRSETRLFCSESDLTTCSVISNQAACAGLVTFAVY